jgi:sulfate permease, SulP family
VRRGGGDEPFDVTFAEKTANAERVQSNLAQLRHYDRSWLRGDVITGVTVAAYLIPQVMAYAGVAGLPPVGGLGSSIVALLAYAVFGSSRRLSIGPESTTALLTSAAVAPLAAGDRGRYATLAAALAAMVDWCVWSPGSPGWASWPTPCPDPCWSAT